MSTLSASVEPFIFNWHPPRRRNLAIAGFLILSLILHAAGFYVFQIVYPPTIALLPPPAHLNLVTSSTEEGRTLLRWVEAEDPALATSTQRPASAKSFALPKIEHVPSYVANEPALKRPPPLTVDLSAPSSQPPGPVPMIRSAPAKKIGVLPTTASFSEEIEKLGKPISTPPKFVASTNEAPESIRFEIAVNNHGEIVYCFALNSSGDPALDEQARKYLALYRFSAESTRNEEALIWGTARIEWGNDVAFPQRPKSTTSSEP
jgi:hypothetical protein